MKSRYWIVAGFSSLSHSIMFAAFLFAGTAAVLSPRAANADMLPCSSNGANMTCITFVNNSNAELNVTMDGNYACYLNPGDRCSYNASVGGHALDAQAGSEGPSVADHKGYLGKGGTSWNLSGNLQNGISQQLTGDWSASPPEEYAKDASSQSSSIPKGSHLATGAQCDDGPCTPTTQFKPGSSLELYGAIIKPKGAPVGPAPKCTVIWEPLTGNEVTGPSSEVIHPGRVIGNHLVFGPDAGKLGVQGHCLEDPSVTTTANSSPYFASSFDPKARSTGTQFAESLGMGPSTMAGATAPRIQSPNPTNSTSSSSDSSNVALDIAAGLGLAAVLAGGGSSSSSNSSGTSNGCPTSEFNTPVPCGCSTSNGINSCNIYTCVPPGCSCPSDSGGPANSSSAGCANGASGCYCK